MGKPPADANPEQFIIGRGLYGNFNTARVFHDEHAVRLDPAPLPVFTVVCANVIFAVFFFGWHCIVEYLGDPKDAPHVWAPMWCRSVWDS